MNLWSHECHCRTFLFQPGVFTLLRRAIEKPRRNALLGDVLAAISRMALLQIDTINVVARSPYLVLFSRLGSYPQAGWMRRCDAAS